MNQPAAKTVNHYPERDQDMPKQVYYAYQIYDGQEGAEIGVDTDAAALWSRFADDLNLVKDAGGIETVEVGTVLATDVEDAINQVRSERWCKEGYSKSYYGTADGVGYEPQEA